MDSSDMITKIASYSESFVTLRTFVVTISLMYDRDVAFELEICSESFVTLRTFVDIRPRSKHRWRPRETKDIYLKILAPSAIFSLRSIDIRDLNEYVISLAVSHLFYEPYNNQNSYLPYPTCLLSIY